MNINLLQTFCILKLVFFTVFYLATMRESINPPSTDTDSSEPIRQAFVPYTGWASFYATGAVWILYNDGTQLGVKSTEASMVYIGQDGTESK